MSEKRPTASGGKSKKGYSIDRRRLIPAIVIAIVIVAVLVTAAVLLLRPKAAPTDAGFSADTGSFEAAESVWADEAGQQDAAQEPATDDTDEEEPVDESLGEFGADPAEGFSWGGETASADPKAVVAEFNGGTVLAGEILDTYNARLAALDFGSEQADSAAVLTEVLTDAVTERVVRARAEALGLTSLSGAEQAECRAQAEELYAEQRADRAALLNADAHMSTDEALSAAEEELAAAGVTVDGLEAALQRDIVAERLMDYAAASVTVSEEELSAAYDALLSEQTELYTADPDGFAAAANRGECVVYVPEGYRIIKDILLPFDDAADVARARELFDAVAVLDPGADADRLMALNDELRALYTGPDERAAAVIARLTAGESFDALMAELDPADMSGAVSLGAGCYYVNAATTGLWSDEVVEGAMNLEAVGQFTPISMRSPEGVHILLYAADAVPGAIALEQVREPLTEQVKAQKADRAYDELVASWVAEAQPVYHPEVLG